MDNKEARERNRRSRAQRTAIAQGKEQVLAALRVERERERLQLQQEDAAKTARLRAQRLAKEAAEREADSSALKGVRAPL